jgi:DNA-binding NarL/FixJ family response regulator
MEHKNRMGKTPQHIRIGILEDHQSIVDGYKYRLADHPDLAVVGACSNGEELEKLLEHTPVDVLLMDLNVPISRTNNNPIPFLFFITRIQKKQPEMNILAISMLTQPRLIKELVEAGIRGYIFKDDVESIQQLAKVVEIMGGGGIYFSEGAFESYKNSKLEEAHQLLSPRQRMILSLCAAYPDSSCNMLAKQMGISDSTLRNTLSNIYKKFNVQTRAAAILKAHQLGILSSPPYEITPDQVNESIKPDPKK